MNCSFGHCKKEAVYGLTMEIIIGKASVFVPVCQSHWTASKRMEERQFYSIADLEKIIEKDPMPNALEAKGLISTLKDRKKVEALL